MNQNKNQSSCLLFTHDAEGKEILLKEGKFQVMMEWERPYMEACIDALQPFGDILEIGFGCGYSARRIQSYHPKSHTIIEYDPMVADRARQFSKEYPSVNIIEDTWQHALDSLGVFDAIFFDDYPLETGEQTQKMKEATDNSHEVLEKGKKVIAEVQAFIAPHLQQSYHDEDLIEFLELATSMEMMQPVYLLSFLEEFKRKNQITTNQQEMAVKAALSKGLISISDLASFVPKDSAPPQSLFDFRQNGDRLFEFLSYALKKHMRKGSRFSCFLEDPTSKFEDKKFLEHIIVNPYLEYVEKWINVEVPKSCQYYKGETALVMTITKMG